MKIWHPLKLTGLCYIATDISLLFGGVVYTDIWIGLSGLAGMLGNWVLLAGGSGAQKIASPWLRRVAPYAERVSMILYALQNVAVFTAGFISQDDIIYSEIAAGTIGFAGCMTALFWPPHLRLKPYQLTGYIWFVSSCLFIMGGLDSGNMGMVAAGFFCVLACVFIVLSRRAEFQSALPVKS